MYKQQDPETAETVKTTSVPAVDLPRLALRLSEADSLKNEWRKKHNAILREVGGSMRSARESSNVSLRTLAKRLGCSAPFLSDMERGNRKYSIEWCNKSFAALSMESKIKPQKKSPVAKSGCASSFQEGVTVDEHAADLRKFIEENSASPKPNHK